MTPAKLGDGMDEQLNSIRLDLLVLNSRLDALLAQRASSSGAIASLQQAVFALQAAAQVKR
ncbi:hypothetical protein ACTAB2_05475 [Pseudomonas syringae]|uniref:hypothetical protein n=1 Tax=Pseudomonas syringae TaxID=317 RepID=UPI003F7A010E